MKKEKQWRKCGMLSLQNKQRGKEMKVKNIILICATLTACTFVDVEKARKNGQEMANQLEEKHDVIETIKQYEKYKYRCYNGKTECISGEAFAINGTDFGCSDSSRDRDYYNSDKCILFRRENGNSKTDYFDYKRFLPKNTKIKTEEDFLKVVNYYNYAWEDCDNIKTSTEELTTQEKQEQEQQVKTCHTKVEKTTLKMAMKNLNLMCSETHEQEYTKELEWHGNRLFKYYIAGRLNPGTSDYYHIMQIHKDAIKLFGAEHGCDTSDWEGKVLKYARSSY